jgi:hypothetical protein
LFCRRKSPIFIILYIIIVVRYIVAAGQSALHQLLSFCFIYLYLLLFIYICCCELFNYVFVFFIIIIYKNKLNSNRVTSNLVQLFSYLSFSLIYSNTHNTKYTRTHITSPHSLSDLCGEPNHSDEATYNYTHIHTKSVGGEITFSAHIYNR